MKDTRMREVWSNYDFAWNHSVPKAELVLSRVMDILCSWSQVALDLVNSCQ